MHKERRQDGVALSKIYRVEGNSKVKAITLQAKYELSARQALVVVTAGIT